MDAKEAAKWVRASFPVFLANQDVWGRYPVWMNRDGIRCVMGGAACMKLGHAGKPFTVGHVQNLAEEMRDSLLEAGVANLANVNDDARNVREMVRGVDRALRKAGL